MTQRYQNPPYGQLWQHSGTAFLKPNIYDPYADHVSPLVLGRPKSIWVAFLCHSLYNLIRIAMANCQPRYCQHTDERLAWRPYAHTYAGVAVALWPFGLRAVLLWRSFCVLTLPGERFFERCVFCCWCFGKRHGYGSNRLGPVGNHFCVYQEVFGPSHCWHSQSK